MPRLATIEDTCWKSIETIASATDVRVFTIGYTSQPLWTRFTQYRPLGFKNLVFLIDRLDRLKSQELEKRLWHRARNADKRSSSFKKFVHNMQGTHYQPGGGTGLKVADHAVHGVYIAWAPYKD